MNLAEKYIVHFKRLLEARNISENIVGYSEKEIVELGNRLGIAIPFAHKELLKAVGYSIGYFLDGSYETRFIESGFELLSRYRRDESECIRPHATNDMVFYFIDYNGIFEYYEAKTDDPEVFYFRECVGFEALGKSFSERIFEKLENRIRFYKEGIGFQEDIDFIARDF